MENFKIGDTDIILEDFGDGKGKIIIANIWGYNFSFFWGCMGSDLKKFLCGINVNYFVTKLSDPLDNGVIDAKKSVVNFRNHFKTEFKHDLPWYKYLEAQKSMREELREIENDCKSEQEFVYLMDNLYKKIDCSSLNYKEEKEFKNIIESACNEPWNFIIKGDSIKTKFLRKLFPKLQKELKRQIKLEKHFKLKYEKK